MTELEHLARQWSKIPQEIRLRTPNGQTAEKIFAALKAQQKTPEA